MPYAGLTYSTDGRSNSNQAMNVNEIGDDAFVWTLGMNFFQLDNKITGGIAYSQESGRSNSDNGSLMANLNIRF